MSDDIPEEPFDRGRRYESDYWLAYYKRMEAARESELQRQSIMDKRDIGAETLEGIKEIQQHKRGEISLKTTELFRAHNHPVGTGMTSELQERILKDFVMDVDGFYYFLPSRRGGHFSAWVLRAIADLLDEKNSAWQKHLEEEFAEQEEDE